MNRSRTIISALASLALGSLMASPAIGALSASPNPSTTGSYTVSGSVSTTRTYGWVSLIETAPGGTTADFDVADAGNISEAFSGKAVGTYTYRVQGCRYDLDEGNPERQEPIVICEDIGASLSVSVVSPPPADPMPDFGTATVPAKSWAQNSAISSFTVPAATGGDTPLTYSASGLPAGVSMNASRSVSGTPGTAGMGTATVTVSDKDGDTDTLSFAWTVAADLTPTFGMSGVSAKSWKQNSTITAFTVPAASGGDAPLSYAASGLPAGVSMTASRQVSGTPTGHGSGTATVTVTDSDGDTATLSFTWAVAEDLAPDFGDASVSYQSWAQNSAITAFTVPAATGGDGTLRYSISGLPAGLSMSGSREVSGTPTASGVGSATVTVTDADGDTDTLRFGWYVGADRTPTFGTAAIADKTFKQNSAITAFYVPIASSGNWPLSYSATGLPAGVSIASNRRVSGTPTAHGMGSATVTVTDSDGDTDTLEFDWTVNEDLSPSFATASVADKDWTLRTRIAAFTVPAATGGDGTLRYSASGLPSGVWMSSSTRRISGSPSGNDARSGTATVTARDADGDTATLEFDWSVEDPMPDFGEAAVSDKTWTRNSAISRFTAPAATGGNTPVRYSASDLPDGVTMSSLRRFSGTPTATGSGTATVTARDADGDTDALTFDWTVQQEDLMPTFGSTVPGKQWLRQAAIATFTVPAATGGDAPLSYSATGLPAGVSMSSARAVSGTPNALGSGTATVTVTDKDGDTDTVSFDWLVYQMIDPPLPPPHKKWLNDQAITGFTVPSASGGVAPLTYSISGLPNGLSMSSSRRVSGTPTANGSGTAIVTITDANSDTDTVSFTWNVETDTEPSFGSASVSAKRWAPNSAISRFTVPGATGGNSPLSYTVRGLPAGVTMSSSRRVSGTPTATGSGTAIVTVTDFDGDTDTLDFDWSVNEDLTPSFATASVADKDWTLRTRIAAFTVPAATGGDGTLRYSASGLPSGVWMSSSTRRISGSPSGNDARSGTATVTARDADGDTATLEFDWSVEDPMPDFGEAAVSDKTWTRNSAISRFTAPAATGGNTPVRYSASDLPDGVTMSSLRRFSGTPTATGSGTATVTARDADGDTDALTFDWTVQQEDLMPTFGSTVPGKQWLRQAAIATFTVPAATGGDAPLSYSATGLPAGVSMSSARAVSGTPNALGSGTATVTVTDKDGDTDTVSFDWLVYQMIDPPLSPPHKKWLKDQRITGFTLPGASGGVAPLSYSISGLPAGLSMSSSRRVSGTPTANGSGTAIVTITDANSDTDTVSFTWNVETDTEPSFGSASVSAKRWEPNSAISRFTVPGATGGNSPLSYTVRGLPAGVAMSSSRRVSGTPTATGTGTAIVTVTDFDGDTDTLRFGWRVASANRTPSFNGVTVAAKAWAPNRAIAAFTIPAASGGDGTVTYAATGLPGGVSMSSLRVVSGTPTAAGTGTATVTARDRDGDTGTLRFTWTVAADLKPAFAAATLTKRDWTEGQAVTAFTVSAATGGDGLLTYTATGLPSGVSMASSRSVSGTPGNSGSGTAIVTATDADGDAASIRFAWAVSPGPGDTAPTFGAVTVATQDWILSRTVQSLTVPAASGGDGTLTYTIENLPDGVSMSASRVVTGTPSTAGSGTAKVTARDTDGDFATLTFEWTVAAAGRLTMGFDEHYTVHTGFLNSDRRTDIYLKHTPDLVFIPVNDKLVPVAPDHADVGDFVLVQTTDGTFEVKALTPSQKTMVSGWAAATGIRLDLSDFNLDNVQDIFMSGLSSALTATPDQNVVDQVVFASPETGARPVHAAAMTQDRRTFFSDAYKWSRDHDYFDDNAPMQQTTRVVNSFVWMPRLCRPLIDQLVPLRRSTISGSVGQTLPEILAEFDAFIANCGVHQYDFISYEFASVRYTISADSKDYTVFHRGALAFADIMTDVIENGGLIAQSKEGQSLEQLLKIIWGIDTFMGDILSRGGTVQGETDIPADQRPESRNRMVDGMILHADLLNALVDARKAETERARQRIYQACYARAWGPDPVSKEKHYARNNGQAGWDSWTRLSDLPIASFRHKGETPTHNIRASGNQDWRGINGSMYHGWQVIFDANGVLVRDYINLGTYDFEPPPKYFLHIEQDITPWIEWGNFPETLDMSTRSERLAALYRTEYGLLSLNSYFVSIYRCLYSPEELD